MNELVSVIVPVYNVEEYLDTCIKSIINQEYTNLEILLIDDGSTDSCLKICNDYAKVDDRIKVIHKENGGLSDARNVGIENCNGSYITFIDSDDYIEKNYISMLYSLIKEYSADISMGKQYVHYPKKIIDTGSYKTLKMNAHETLEKMMYSEDVDVSAWAKLYKTELFDNIRFPKGRLYEDSATTYKLIDKSQCIVLKSIPIYNYIIRNSSITNNAFAKQKMDLIVSTKEMTTYVSEKYPDLKDSCDRRLMYAYLSTLVQYNKTKSAERHYFDELWKYIKENRKKVLRDKRIPKRDRIALISTYFGAGFFKISWNVFKKIKYKQ